MGDLAVIVPVYNEEESVSIVINEWTEELEKLNIDYKIFIYNDGSKDNTSSVMKELAEKNNRIIAIDKQNSGHGPTILRGYKENCANFEWLFQTDSDNEMSAKDFYKLWEQRKDYDFLIGTRANRPQPFMRKLVSIVSRICIRLFYGKGVWDVNSPYRLMKSEIFEELFEQIPSDTFAPNVIISGFIAKKKIKFYQEKVLYQQRQTGEVSLNKIKLCKVAIKSFWQTIAFSFIVK